MTILKTTLLAAIALLLAVQVPAKDPDITILKVKPVQPQMHILPPPEYDHDYDGKLTLKRTSTAEVIEACREAVNPKRPPPLGCSQIKSTIAPKRCTIWIVTDDELRGWDFNLVLRHEIGHCNGWRHDKDGKTLPDPPPIERKIEQWCAQDPYLLVCGNGIQ